MWRDRGIAPTYPVNFGVRLSRRLPGRGDVDQPVDVAMREGRVVGSDAADCPAHREQLDLRQLGADLPAERQQRVEQIVGQVVREGGLDVGELAVAEDL